MILTAALNEGCENLKDISFLIMAVLEKTNTLWSRSLDKTLSTVKVSNLAFSGDVKLQNKIIERVSNRFYPENEKLFSHETYFNECGPMVTGIIQKSQRLSKIFG
jgi:hypothetical protein